MFSVRNVLKIVVRERFQVFRIPLNCAVPTGSGCRRVRFGSTVPFSNVIRFRAPDLTLESSIAKYGSALSRGKSDFAEYG